MQASTLISPLERARQVLKVLSIVKDNLLWHGGTQPATLQLAVECLLTTWQPTTTYS